MEPIQIAITLGKAYMEREEAKTEEQKVREILKRVSEEIRIHTGRIIERMETLRIERLQGNFNGMVRLFNEYEPIPQNEQLLNNLITNSSFFILGELEVILKSNDIDLKIQLEAIGIYSITINLRALAMKERKYTFGISTDDHILTMFKDNLNYLDMLNKKLTSLLFLKKDELDRCVTLHYCPPLKLCLEPFEVARPTIETTHCSSEKNSFDAAQNQLIPYIDLRKQLEAEIKKLESPS